MNKIKMDYKPMEPNGLTACGLILRWAGIIAFLLLISIDLDKVL